MKGNLARRLQAVETETRRRSGEGLLGTIEVHRLDGWPACEADTEIQYQQCTEHGPTCGASITRIPGPLRRVILLGIPDDS